MIKAIEKQTIEAEREHGHNSMNTMAVKKCIESTQI